MAWTTPSTAVAGETALTAALWNEQVRDNLLALINIKSTTVTEATFSHSTTSYTTITGLTVSITPTTATSKILLIAQVSLGSDISSPGLLRFTGGNSGDYVGDAASTRIQAATQLIATATSTVQPTVLVYLDSPNTTSATTYGVQIRRGGLSTGTFYLNRAHDDADNTNRLRAASSITAIEVPV